MCPCSLRCTSLCTPVLTFKQCHNLTNHGLFLFPVLSKGKLTVGKIYAGLLIVENWKSTKFGKIAGPNALSVSIPYYFVPFYLFCFILIIELLTSHTKNCHILAVL